MRLQKNLLKRALIALFLFLLSCSPCCQQWYYDEVRTSCPTYNSQKMFLFPENEFRGVELEIIRTCSGEYVFLNVYALSFPREQDNPNTTLVVISCGDLSNKYLADRFEGGQRLLLPKEAEMFIITKLLEGKQLTVSTGRFCSEIIPRGFCEAYHKFSLK
jgi:hypothetical protein